MLCAMATTCLRRAAAQDVQQKAVSATGGKSEQRATHVGKGSSRVSLRARSESCAATSRVRLVICSSAFAPVPAANTTSPKPLPLASSPRNPACGQPANTIIVINITIYICSNRYYNCR